MNHKDFYLGQDISSLKIDEAHKKFIGFNINRGSTGPRNIVQKWSCQQKLRPNYASTVEYAIIRAAVLIDKIKNWQVTCFDYRQLENIKGTWFIDPPYQCGGSIYPISDINYQELAEWCMTRRGQIIVCENEKANWLPFKHFKKITGQSKKTNEVIFYLNN